MFRERVSVVVLPSLSVLLTRAGHIERVKYKKRDSPNMELSSSIGEKPTIRSSTRRGTRWRNIRKSVSTQTEVPSLPSVLV